MRHATFRDQGQRIGEKKGVWARWTAQALFAWARTHDEPGKSGTCGYIAAGLLRDDVSSGHHAPAHFWTVGAMASHGNGRLLDTCFRVFAHCVKRKFSTLSLHSAVENGSFSSTGFEPLPLGYVPTVLPTIPRGQVRLASVETNTSDTHRPAPW